MFCPSGYVPFTITSADFASYFEGIVRFSIDHGDSLFLKSKTKRELSHYCLMRGGFEKSIFLTDCDSVSVCGFDGTLLRVDSNNFLEMADSYWVRDWFPNDLKLNENRFLFIDPHTYTVSTEFWRNYVSEILEKNAYKDWLLLHRQAAVVSRFEDWAVCISREDNKRIPEFIVERLELPTDVLENMLNACSSAGAESRKGRPALAKARAEFERMNYDKGKMSWEQLARHLERKTGEKPSPRTMRTWVSEATARSSPRD